MAGRRPSNNGCAHGGYICYLDEIVEARQDTTVVIHLLTDHRRSLPLDKKGELIEAHPVFQLVISYNPGYQSLMKDLKQFTRQRFGGMDFDYPEEKIEINIVSKESGVDMATAEKLVLIAHRIPHLPDALDDYGDVAGLEVYRATAAHMASHMVYSNEPISAEGLSPAQMFFIGLIEDARVDLPL